MRGLRQLTTMVGALTTAFALVLLGAPPSAAGGPTSVLLASPTARRTASLYGTDKAYSHLEKLLAPAGSELDRSRVAAPEWEGEMAGDMVNVAWMVHDVTPWRVDHVYSSAPAARDVWIHTTLSIGNDSDAPAEGVWHKAKQPEELRKLLAGLGLMGDGSEGSASGSPAQSEPSPADSRPDSGTGTAMTTADDKAAPIEPGLADRAWWAIPGLGLGLLLGSGATLLLRRTAARHGSGPPREPRQELIDV